MSAANIDLLMELWSKEGDDTPPFSGHKDLYNTIDASTLGDIPWERATLSYQGEVPEDGEVPEWMTAGYEIFYRNPHEVVKNMLEDTTFAGVFDYTAYREFDHDGNRRYENFMSGDWAWQQSVSLLLP